MIGKKEILERVNQLQAQTQVRKNHTSSADNAAIVDLLIRSWGAVKR